MNYELRLSSEAERCIENQIQWYETNATNGGEELAGRWMDLLEAALDTLSRHPERHGFAPENGRWMPAIPIRQMRFKPWKTQDCKTQDPRQEKSCKERAALLHLLFSCVLCLQVLCLFLREQGLQIV